MNKATEILPVHTLLLDDIRQIINQARGRVAVNVNSELTLMYWHIGERINRELLDSKRAAYGKQIVAPLVRQLSWTHFLRVMPIKTLSPESSI